LATNQELLADVVIWHTVVQATKTSNANEGLHHSASSLCGC